MSTAMGIPKRRRSSTTGELEIWFDGLERTSYVINADGTQWVARGGKILVGSDASAFEVTPGKVYVNGTNGATAAPGHRIQLYL